MNRAFSITPLLVLIATLGNPFCWLTCISAQQLAVAAEETGDLHGTVFWIHIVASDCN